MQQLRSAVLALTAIAALTAQASAQAPPAGQRRPLSLEDYYRVSDLAGARISPDGRWVLAATTTPVEENNSDVVSLWVMRADGSAAPVEVPLPDVNVSAPRWGDDNQLRYNYQRVTWMVDPARPSQPARRDPAPTSPAGLSPDGRWVARAIELPSAPPIAPPAMSDFERRHEERFQGDAFDWYPFRQDGRRFPLPDGRNRPPTEVFLIAVDTSAPPRQLTNLGLQAGSVQWTPDGSELVFTATNGFLDELAYGSSDIFRVTRDGAVTRLTNDKYNYSGVSVSPDGRWLAYERSMSTDMIIEQKLNNGGAQDLFVLPMAGGAAVNLTAEWDFDPGAIRWSPDSRYMYFTAGVAGTTQLFRAAPAGGIEQVTRGDRRIADVDFDSAFTRMSYIAGTFDAPDAVFTANIDGSSERQLFNPNARMLDSVQFSSRTTERISWSSYDGSMIEGFLMYPANYDPAAGSYPLIVMNHGGPHVASGYGFSFKNSLFAAAGYFVFLPNFRGSTGYGDDFKWATWGGWGNRDGEDVMSGIDHLTQTLPVDRNRVGSTGHSYGGILTNWLITRYPDRFRAAIPGAGESNWTSNFALSDISRTKETEFFGPPWDPRAREIMIAQSPALNCGGVKAATLFIHGSVDYRVPLEGAIQLYTCLKKQRIPAKMIIYEGESHGISGHWNAVHRMQNELRWWDNWLKPVDRPSGGGH